MKHNLIKDALNNTLSRLPATAPDAGQLLARARGGEKVKRKLSIALVLAVVLLLLTFTALALVFGWTDGAHYLRREQAYGAFPYWTVQEQVQLVESLIADGHISGGDKAEQLRDASISDAERSALATAIMLDWLGASGDEYIAFRPIMERIWGTFGDWTVAQKAWFTNTLMEAGVQQPDFERHVLPTQEHISQDMARRIAMAYLSTWFDIPLADLAQDHAYTSFVVFPKPRLLDGRAEYTTEDQPAQWFFEFGVDDKAKVPHYLTIAVDAVTGYVDTYQFVQALQQRHYMRNWPDIALQAENFFKTQDYRPFMEWSLEARAQWSQEMAPAIRQHEGAQLDDYLHALCKYQYGLPEPGMLQSEQATQTAITALVKAHQLKEQELEKYDLRYLYFDVTDTARSKWRLHLSASGKQADMLTNGHPENLTHYVVEIDAWTGETISVSSYAQSDHAGFEAIIMQL